jgi:hypothetical protein
VKFHGPYAYPLGISLDEDSRRAILEEALAGVELGAFDHAVVAWLVGVGTPRVASVAGMIQRARGVERVGRRRRPRPYTRRPVPGRAYVTLSPAVVDLIRGEVNAHPTS